MFEDVQKLHGKLVNTFFFFCWLSTSNKLENMQKKKKNHALNTKTTKSLEDMTVNHVTDTKQ